MTTENLRAPLREIVARYEKDLSDMFGPDAAELAGIARAAFNAADKAEQSFQARVQPWMMACFGPEISADGIERNHRFLEEALELVQALGCSRSEAHQLVDYTFDRPLGDPKQEVGGVMVTLAAFCLAHGLDMAALGETELARIWTKVEQIRAKQAAKPKHSPLPQHVIETNPRLADPIAAIEFALTVDDHYDRREFLNDWMHGDLAEWPDFTGNRGAENKEGAHA